MVMLPHREFLELNDKEYPAQRGYSAAQQWHNGPVEKHNTRKVIGTISKSAHCADRVFSH